jgi:poly(A) polymerase
LRNDWRLSNAEAEHAREIGAAANLVADGRLAEAAYRYWSSAHEAVDVAAARADWPRHDYRSAVSSIARMQPKPLPLNGADLLRAGLQAGPAIGRALAELEAAWIESGFTLGEAELEARLRSLVSAPGPRP